MMPEVALFIDPPTHHLLGDRLFDSGFARHAGEDLLAPHRAVREHFQALGIPVHTADRLGTMGARRNLLVSLGRVETARDTAGRPDVVPSAFFAMECPIVEPTLYRGLPEMAGRFRRLFCWTDGEALAPFTGSQLAPARFWWPQSFDTAHPEFWQRGDRGLLVMINANKLPRLYDRELYTARLEAVAFFHQYRDIHLYGKHWDRMPSRVGRTWVPATVRRLHGWTWRQWQWVHPHPLYRAAREAYRGAVDSKLEALSRYRFALCFENMTLRGWITEKLFDCLFAGTVPIYWGAPDIGHWVDPACFLDMRRFGGYDELRTFLHACSPAAWERMREAGRDYLASEAFDRFRRKAWVDRFRAFVREDAGVET